MSLANKLFVSTSNTNMSVTCCRARALVERQINMLRGLPANSEMITMLIADLQQMLHGLVDRQSYMSSGTSRLLSSGAISHSRQQTTTVAAPSSRAYSTR